MRYIRSSMHILPPPYTAVMFFSQQKAVNYTRDTITNSNGGCLVGATVAAVLTTAPAAYKMHGGTGDKDCVLDITGKLSGSPKEFVQDLGVRGKKK